jgi:hypothetical protein
MKPSSGLSLIIVGLFPKGQQIEQKFRSFVGAFSSILSRTEGACAF